ncbi:MAG: DUF481 domain-containing protein [Gemmatimonadota bacterium]
MPVRQALAFVLALALPAGLRAQQEPHRDSVAAVINFGLINTAGNTSTTSLNGDYAVSYLTGYWTFSQLLAVVYGKTNGAVTAEEYRGGIRAEWAVSRCLSFYGLGNYYRNRLGGIDHRYEEGTGLLFKAIDQPKQTFNLEAGVSFLQETPVTDPQNNFTAPRAAAFYKHLLGKTAFFSQAFEVLPDLRRSKDVRLNTETTLDAPLSTRIALKVAYVVRFDNEPQPGFKKTDRYLTSGVQVSL